VLFDHIIYLCMHVCVPVCGCVCEGEKQGQWLGGYLRALLSHAVYLLCCTLHYITCHLADAFIQRDLQ